MSDHQSAVAVAGRINPLFATTDQKVEKSHALTCMVTFTDSDIATPILGVNDLPGNARSGSLSEESSGISRNGEVETSLAFSNAMDDGGELTGSEPVYIAPLDGEVVPITRWTVWGPGWGRAGLGVLRYNAEGEMRPQPGDIDISTGIGGRGMIAWQAILTDPDGSIDFMDPDRFERINASRNRSSYDWAGMVEYLHTFIRASKSQNHEARLEIISEPYPAEAWLNGFPVSDGDSIVLKKGWNRLMIKSLSPATSRGNSFSDGWGLSVRLLEAPPRIEFRRTDPSRKVLVTDDGKAFRYLSTFTRYADGDFPVFTATEKVKLSYRVKVATGNAPSYQAPSKRTNSFRGWPWVYTVDPSVVSEGGPNQTIVPAASWTNYAPAQVKFRIKDDRGKTVYQRSHSLSFGSVVDDQIMAERQFEIGNQPVGHYTIVSEFCDASGNVLARDYDHSFAIVWGPVDRTADQTERSLSAVGHWLLGTSEMDSSGYRYPSRLRWLARVGFTRQQKLWEGWDKWNATQDGSGNVFLDGDSGRISGALAMLEDLDIDIVGDLLEGYYSASMDNLDLPGEWHSQPVYGTQAWEEMYFQYGYQLAQKYNGSVLYWGGLNEVDLRGARRSRAAEMYVKAATQIEAGIRAADSRALYISSSLVRQRESQELFNNGLLDVPDIVDVHSHPWRAPNPGENTLTPYSNGEGRRMLLRAGYTGKMIYGEMSAPRAHNPRGALGQAEDMVKQLVWALNWRDVTEAPVMWISYLVPYNAPDYRWGQGFNNIHGDPLPVVNAANVASHLLDGRNVLPAIHGLPSGVHQLRVDGADGLDTLIVWSDTAQLVDLPILGASADLIDIFGRTKTVQDSKGRIRIQTDKTPIYIRGRFQ